MPADPHEQPSGSVIHGAPHYGRGGFELPHIKSDQDLLDIHEKLAIPDSPEGLPSNLEALGTESAQVQTGAMPAQETGVLPTLPEHKKPAHSKAVKFGALGTATATIAGLGLYFMTKGGSAEKAGSGRPPASALGVTPNGNGSQTAMPEKTPQAEVLPLPTSTNKAELLSQLIGYLNKGFETSDPTYFNKVFRGDPSIGLQGTDTNSGLSFQTVLGQMNEYRASANGDPTYTIRYAAEYVIKDPSQDDINETPYILAKLTRIEKSVAVNKRETQYMTFKIGPMLETTSTTPTTLNLIDAKDPVSDVDAQAFIQNPTSFKSFKMSFER